MMGENEIASSVRINDAHKMAKTKSNNDCIDDVIANYAFWDIGLFSYSRIQ